MLLPNCQIKRPTETLKPLPIFIAATSSQFTGGHASAVLRSASNSTCDVIMLLIVTELPSAVQIRFRASERFVFVAEEIACKGKSGEHVPEN